MTTRSLDRGLTRALSFSASGRRFPAGTDFLDGIVSNMELELQMNTDQGQRILNKTASPDSGASQTDNDFFLGLTSGSDSTDPTFNTDRHDFDGGDLFTAAVDTSFMDTVNFSSNCDITFIIVFDKGATLANNDYLFSSGSIAFGGLSLNQRSNGDLRVQQDSGGTSLFSDLAISISTTTTDNVLVLSINAANSRLDAHYNSKTPVSNTALSFDTTDTDDSSTETAAIGANINTQFLPNGDSMSFFAIRNKESTDAEAESIIDYLSDNGFITAIP